MIENSALRVRSSMTLAYLESIEEARHSTWEQFAVGYGGNVARDLVLLHPAWFGGLAHSPAGLALSRFTGEYRSGQCACERLWGYGCPIREVPIESDHLFPRSLGGPAIASNQVWLCRIHNAWKAADLTLFPWEEGRPAWLENQYRLVRTTVSPDANFMIL